MRTAQSNYVPRHNYSPKETQGEVGQRKQKRDTSVDWVTIPRLTAVTLCLFVVTLVFNGI